MLKEQIELFDDDVQLTAANDNEPVNDFEAQWRVFHEKNPQIYKLIERFTAEAMKAGLKHYSMRGIFERIRWYTRFEADHDYNYKLPNFLSPYYARHYMRMNPQHDGFFRTLTVKGE